MQDEVQSTAFGRLLRTYRLRAGLTQEALAERAGLGRRSIQDLELGECRPRRGTLQCLIKALALPPAELAILEAAAQPAPRRSRPVETPNPDAGKRDARVAASRQDHPHRSASTPDGASVSVSTSPTNLPAAFPALIGREPELAILREWLEQPDVRLLTLTGPGGIGKTCLAFQLASDVLSAFSDGVYVVSLASVSEPQLVLGAIARTLDVNETAGRPLLDQLKHWLRERHLLLILDNFERLVSAAPLVADLLAETSSLKVLATSRAVLRLRGEREYVVPPLGLPPRELVQASDVSLAAPSSHGTLTEPFTSIAEAPAVRLFVARARDVNPDFALTSENALPIADICSRLDGLPLAIELAAARTRLLSPTMLQVRLQHRLPLLTRGARDLPARQQSLHETITWSHDLLEEKEKILFRRLAVFAGGCTLEAAGGVAGDGGDVLDHLESLVEQSLVQRRETAEGELRFGMLETIREYALERLNASGESAEMRNRHASWFRELAEQAMAAFLSQSEVALVTRVETEHDNLLAALTWCRESGDVESGLRLGAALWDYWYHRGRYTEGKLQLALLLALPGITAYQALLASVRQAAGHVAWHLGDYPSARSHLEQAVNDWRAVEDRGRLGVGLAILGAVVRDQGDLDAAVPWVEEALQIGREVGDWGLTAFTLMNLGIIAREQGDLMQATARFEESLEISRAPTANEYMPAGVLQNLGLVAEDAGDYVWARSLYRESLTMSIRVEAREGIAYILEGIASLDAKSDQPIRALRLIGAMARLREEVGIPVPPMMQGRYARILERATRLLSPGAAGRALAEGRATSWREACRWVLEQETT